jgi:hypothetical protein
MGRAPATSKAPAHQQQPTAPRQAAPAHLAGQQAHLCEHVGIMRGLWVQAAHIVRLSPALADVALHVCAMLLCQLS